VERAYATVTVTVPLTQTGEMVCKVITLDLKDDLIGVETILIFLDQSPFRSPTFLNEAKR